MGGSRGATYTKLGISAREISMGRCGVSVSEGSSSIYWNPANLIKQDQRRQFLGITSTVMNQQVWDIQYGAFSSAYALRRFAIGFGALYYQVSDIEHWDENMYYHGNFNNTELAGLGALSFRIHSSIVFGTTLWIHQHTFSLTDDKPLVGFGGQLGLNFYPVSKMKDFKFSINLIDDRNISTNILGSAIDTTEMTLIVGLSNMFNILDASFVGPITTALELEQTRHTPLEFRFGIENEWILPGGVQLFSRVGLDDYALEYSGWRLDKESNLWNEDVLTYKAYRKIQRKFTFGIGLQYRPFPVSFDYAIVLERYRTLHFITLSLWP